MSKHSNSIRTNSLTSPMTSFFDTGAGDDRFWQAKAKETEFVDVPKIVEGEFRIYHKTFFKEWEKCRLSIRGNFLVFKKKKSSKNVEFLDFHKNMYRFEIISEIHKKHSAKYPHGFSLYSNGVSMEFFCKDSTQVISWMSHLRKLCIMTNFNDNYKVLEVLGSGGYGKVHRIDSIQDSRKFAGKFIKISSTMNRERQKTMIVNEIRMLRKLDHPQIVKLYEVYEMPGQICLVMELVQGEKLFTYITERKSLSEEATAYLMKQLLIILSHLESQDIIHRDIKPENILYTLDENGKVQLKLIDFGLATFNKKRDMIKKCGTAGYVAPEILNNDAYNFKADLYSAGVIMYICLTGRPLFHAKDYDELLAKNRSGIIKYRGSTWSKLSAEAQDLVQRLLDPIPSFRISLADALNHEWFIHNIDPEDRKDLLDHIFKVVKLNIPQEKTISRIPTTSGKIPYVQKSNALSLPSISSHQRNVSGSFFTSNVQLGVDDHHKELHPFYKIISSEASNHSHLSHLSISVTNSSASGNQSKTLNGIPVAVTPLKGNTLRPPTIAPNSPRRQNQSLRSSLKTIEPQRYAGGYSIQVSAAESHDDLEVGFEGEGSLCSTNYEDLKRNPFRFARLGRRTNTYSFTEAGIAPIRIHSNRCETEIETPRNKFRVVPVNSGLRRQVAESFC